MLDVIIFNLTFVFLVVFTHGFLADRYEQRDAHEFLSDLVDFLHDELIASKTPPSSPGENEAGSSVPPSQEEGRLSPKENKNPNEVEGREGLELAESTTKHNCEEVLPTDEYFHLNVRVCLECDSCGYSR